MNKDLKVISEKWKNIGEEWVLLVRVKIECLDFFYIYKRVKYVWYVLGLYCYYWFVLYIDFSYWIIRLRFVVIIIKV